MSEYENSSLIPQAIMDNVLDWLSAGIDPSKSTIFIQSEVPEHLQLYMIFSCMTPLGLLERCPTYKEQMREIKTRNLNTYGFLGYPVLQAADILLYRADKVPVGRDQMAHLELTREIARIFNRMYKKEVFPYPDAILTQTPKLLGLDGRKMSKSYLNTINISDSPAEITKKISSMFTDPKRIRLSDIGHPDTCNVYAYYSTFVPELKQEAYDWCSGARIGCTECKKRLSCGIIEKISPLQKKRQCFAKDKDGIRKMLDCGRDEARSFASGTIKEVFKAMRL